MASLGEKAVGSIVKLNVSGTPREFIVVHQGLPSSAYDSSCDGTWLLMKDIYQNAAWDADGTNRFDKSGIYTLLNGDILNAFDEAIRNCIRTVKIPCATAMTSSGSVVTGANGLAAKLFLLSRTEYGLSKTNYTHTEGAALAYFNGAANAKRIAYLNGTASTHWTRSLDWYNEYFCYISAAGSASSVRDTKSYGVRPALVLPYDLNVADDGLIGGSSSASGGIIGEVNIGGVMHKLTGEGFINKKGVLYPIILGSKVKIGSVLKDLLLGVEVKTSRLPDGYTEVEYIQFNNAPYIDTGMKLPSSFKMELGLTPMGSFGLIAGVQWSSPKFELTVWDNNMAYTTADTAFTGTTITPGSGKYDLVCTNNSYTVNGATETKTVSASNSTSYNLRIGAHGSGEIDSYRATMKLYYFRLYSAETLVRDFVPCKNSSGTVGMYDLVNNKFYGNNGTGSLTAGAEV